MTLGSIWAEWVSCAGKLTSPEFFDKEVLVLLVRNMCESFDKNGKTKCAHKCFTQSKGFIL